MANLFTHALTFTKENIAEFFIEPFFEAIDIRNTITIRTDIKGTEKLNKVSRPSKVTRKKTSAGFTPTGDMVLTQQEITVKPVAVEFEQNGRAFLDSVLQEALAQGFNEDDVAQMADPDFWNQIVLPVIAQAGREDLIRQMFFADEKKETFDGDNFITGTGDVDYDVYTGFWTHFIGDVRKGIIPAAQRITIDNGAVKQEEIQTLSGITAGQIDIQVNNVSFTEAFDTDSTTTITNWFASHAAIIQARGELTGVVVTNPSAAALKFVAQHPGQQFEIVIIDAGTDGSFAQSAVVANVVHAALGTDEAENTLTKMVDAMPDELLQFNPIIKITRSMARNYIQTLKNLGTEQAHRTVLEGVGEVMTFEGFPLIVRPDWDKWLRIDHNKVFPHRAAMYTGENLLFATDGANDDEAVETWYNQDLQQRRYRVQYKGQTAYLHKELLMLAY